MKLACAAVALLSIVLSGGVAAQDLTPPAPLRFVLHSSALNEDRYIFIRTPRNYDQGKDPLPVLYLTDGPNHINEIGSTIDFLAEQGRIPPLIVVGIGNTDRTRDLTPTRSNEKNDDGSVAYPTSGGGDRFIDFIQNEVIPQIDQHYRTAPFRVFAGHSFGGLTAIYILITRPEMFQAYIAVSPSLQWEDERILHQAQRFFAAHPELNKRLFFSLANEGNQLSPMGDAFDQLRNTLKKKAPRNFHWDSARYPDETHDSTVLLAHYAGLRSVFYDWEVPRDAANNSTAGLDAIEKHFRELSGRYGYAISPPEDVLTGLGYGFLADKKFDEAIAAFQRNVALRPASANGHDSLGEAYENARKFDLAKQEYEKAIELATQAQNPPADQFRRHLERVTEKVKSR